MRVKAAVLRQYGAPLEIEALDLDEPQEGEIFVRLVAAGVSRSDLDAIAGRSGVPVPFVPGAEAAGFVERVGEGVGSPEPGDAVLVAWSAGRDRGRRDRLAALDTSGRRADGSTPFHADAGEVFGLFQGQAAFATHLLCRATDAMAVDAEVPLDLAVALTGEFLTGAAPVLRLPDARPGAAIVVTGANMVGLAACLVAKARGYDPIIIAEPDEKRRTLALDVGATIAVPADDGLAAAVRSLAASGAVLALDASGTAAGRKACLASLAPSGIYAAAASADDTIDASQLVPQLLALQAGGDLPIEKLIDFFSFEHVNDAIAAAISGACLKPLLRFSLGSFGDLDRAKREGAATDEAADEPSSEPGADDAESERAAPAEVSA